MSSRGDEQRRSAAGQPGQEDNEEEDFFDCQEVLQALKPEGSEEGITKPQTDRENRTGGGPREKQEEGDGLKEEEQQVEEGGNGPKERKQVEEYKVEEEGDGLKAEMEMEEKEEDSDSEFKEEVGPVEFDEEYLMELEKELTEEEKESRRQQSFTLKEAGNASFKAGDWSAAEQSYTEALSFCPVCFSKDRSVLFSNRAAARVHKDLKDSAISDCNKAIELDPSYLRALLRRAELYEQTEKLDEALEDYQKILELNPSHPGAREACRRLPHQIHERNEKLKEEMMGKLKDLGNLFLRPFGLSTNNFQVNQDEASGSYSVNFVQRPEKR